MPSSYLPLSPTYGFFETSPAFDHRLPTSDVRTSPSYSLSSSCSSCSSTSFSSSSSSPRESTPSRSTSYTICSKKKYDPVHFEVEIRRRRREEEEESAARPGSSSSSRSSDDGEWKPYSRPSEVGVLTEKELARKERRKAVNRASECCSFFLETKSWLDGLKLTFLFTTSIRCCSI